MLSKIIFSYHLNIKPLKISMVGKCLLFVHQLRCNIRQDGPNYLVGIFCFCHRLNLHKTYKPLIHRMKDSLKVEGKAISLC